MKAKWAKSLWLLLFVIPVFVVFIVQLITRTPLFAHLSPSLAGSFLATVAQVLAGILAIVFSVSVLAVGVVSDRYTPRLFRYIALNRATLLSFFSILALVIVSVVAMGVQDIPMSQWRFLSMTGLFVLCSLTLPYYFYQTLQILNPLTLADLIQKEAQQGLKKQDQQKALEAVTSLGDIAIKALERGEDEITKKYLYSLGQIEQELVTSGLELFSSNLKKHVTSALFGLGIRSPIFEQCYRVFKTAISKRNEDITLYIVEILSETITTVTEQRNGKEALKVRLWQYQDFVKAAIENKDVSRFALIQALRKAILPYSIPGGFIQEDYAPIILTTILRVNKVIIDCQDFELWKKELNDFSTISSINDTYFDLTNTLRELLLHDELLNINWAWWEKMDWPIQTRITPTNKGVIELGLSRIRQAISSSSQDLQEKPRKIEELLYRLWATTGVYDVFFWVCSYAFYRKQIRYIKELWRHVNPKDASAHWGNTNLIRFDTGFLTCQMVSQVWIPDEFENYHSSEIYVLRYFLLCLAYTLQHNGSDWHPATPFVFEPLLGQDEEYSETVQNELKAAHAFLTNLSYYADKALAQYDTVVSEKEEWEDVFDGKISDALEQARDWLADTQRRQEWTSKAEGIIRDLPLDSKRVETYRKTALEYYEGESQVKYLAIQAESSDRQNAVDLTGCWRFQPPDKQHFTLIGLDEPERIGARVGFAALHELVRLEISYIAEILLTEKEQETIPLQRLDFDNVLKTVEKIKQAGYTATVLITSNQAISSAWQKDHQFRVNMKYENQNERYLQIDTDTKLKIIELQGDYAFIFSKEVGSWATIEPLVIKVKECDKDPLSVEISATEVVVYQMLNPQAVEILKFDKQKELS
jgi:hypothetical protein